VALTKSVSRAMQRQIDLTTAVCQERLMATHVRHVLAFVDLVSDKIPFDEALDMYVRILQLNAEQARNIGSRALAEIGRRTGMSEAPPSVDFADDADADAELEPEPRSTGSEGRSDVMFGRLRRRIRGRVQADLRERINLAAARTEDAMLETHVENALIFVKALGDEASASDAVEHYINTMMLAEGLGDVVYNRALRLIADAELPPVEGGAGRVAAAEAPAATKT
jgi:hypothetical protein